MAEYYTFVDAEPVTVFVPPNGSHSAMQVRGVEPHSGIYFLSIMSRKGYLDAAFRNVHMNAIGRALYLDSQTPNVAGISVRQVQDAQTQLRNELTVDVESTSGNSSGRITLSYPRADHVAADVAHFQTVVAAEAQLLDAAEQDNTTANTSALAQAVQVVENAEKMSLSAAVEIVAGADTNVSLADAVNIAAEAGTLPPSLPPTP
jgi:hypothetical protein